MTDINKAQLKKDQIDKAESVYKTLGNVFKNFKLSVDKLREKVDTIDLTNQLFKTSFGNSYNILLSDLVSSVRNILQARRTAVGDDGSLVIRPVNVSTNDYFSEIWYGHTVIIGATEQRFPPRIVCKYDNFSVEKVIENDLLIAYDFIFGDKKCTINTSIDIGLDAADDVIVQSVIDKLNIIILTSSYLQDYCLINQQQIAKYKTLFVSLYMS